MKQEEKSTSFINHSTLQRLERNCHQEGILLLYRLVIVAFSHDSLKVISGLSNYQLTPVIFVYCCWNWSTDNHIAVYGFVIIKSGLAFLNKRVFFLNIPDDSSYKVVSKTALSCLTVFIDIIFVKIYLALFFFFINVFYDSRRLFFHIFVNKWVSFWS